MSETDKLSNPIRLSIGRRDFSFEELGVEVEKIEIRPSEGNIYIHWDEKDDS